MRCFSGGNHYYPHRFAPSFISAYSSNYQLERLVLKHLREVYTIYTHSDLIAYLVYYYGLKEGEVALGADATLYDSVITCNLVFDHDEYGDVVHWDTSSGCDGTINLGDNITLSELKNLTNALDNIRACWIKAK